MKMSAEMMAHFRQELNPSAADYQERANTLARRLLFDYLKAYLQTGNTALIEYNDGSVTDFFLRSGVPFAAALETTTATPLEACHAINLIWIRGFIDLAARGGNGST